MGLRAVNKWVHFLIFLKSWQALSLDVDAKYNEHSFRAGSPYYECDYITEIEILL